MKLRRTLVVSKVVKIRAGWPLLTVEIEVYGDSHSKNASERGPSLAVRWACRAGTRDFCSALAALVVPVQNIFSPP